LIEVLKEGGRRTARDTADSVAACEQGRGKGVLEVGGGPDERAPLVSGRDKTK
jgi:hypothetical protein